MKTMLNSIPSASNDAENNTNDDVITSAHYIRNTVLVAVDSCQPRKVCTKCKEQKSIVEFGKLKQGKNGINPVCKKCCSKRILEYFKIHNYKWQKKANIEKPIYRKIANDNYRKKDNYIISQTRRSIKSSGFPIERITEDLIQVKILINKTKRLCKTSQN